MYADLIEITYKSAPQYELHAYCFFSTSDTTGTVDRRGPTAEGEANAKADTPFSRAQRRKELAGGALVFLHRIGALDA